MNNSDVYTLCFFATAVVVIGIANSLIRKTDSVYNRWNKMSRPGRYSFVASIIYGIYIACFMGVSALVGGIGDVGAMTIGTIALTLGSIIIFSSTTGKLSDIVSVIAIIHICITALLLPLAFLQSGVGGPNSFNEYIKSLPLSLLLNLVLPIYVIRSMKFTRIPMND